MKEFIIQNKNLMSEWNWEENNKIRLNPNTLTCGVKTKAFWTCKNGHTWQASINSRSSGRNCPYCANKKVLKGINDLQTVNPDLASEWDCEKNNPLKPIDVLPNSHKKVWWKCCNGHSWEAIVSDRNNGNGCPYCSGRYVIKGKNDLLTVNPILASEWNYEKNDRLTPMDVLPNSNKKVWWKCRKGHEWQSYVSSRTFGAKCPFCRKKKSTKE